MISSQSLNLGESVLKAETSISPEVHPLAILGVMSFLVVLPGANGFATGETHRLLSHVPDMSLAFVFVVEDVLAYAAIPLPSSVVERRGSLAAV